MPNHEKVLRGAQGAPLASVLPTTQAATSTRWKRISRFNIPKSFSTTPDCYAIKIIGEAFNYTTTQMREVEVQRLYRSHHPTCAVGRAVIDFLAENCRASITHIEILKAENK